MKLYIIIPCMCQTDTV